MKLHVAAYFEGRKLWIGHEFWHWIPGSASRFREWGVKTAAVANSQPCAWVNESVCRLCTECSIWYFQWGPQCPPTVGFCIYCWLGYTRVCDRIIVSSVLLQNSFWALLHNALTNAEKRLGRSAFIAGQPDTEHHVGTQCYVSINRVKHRSVIHLAGTNNQPPQ